MRRLLSLNIYARNTVRCIRGADRLPLVCGTLNYGTTSMASSSASEALHNTTAPATQITDPSDFEYSPSGTAFSMPHSASTKLLAEVLDPSTVWDESLVDASVSAAIMLDNATALEQILSFSRAQGLTVPMITLRRYMFTAERTQAKSCVAMLRSLMAMKDDFIDVGVVSTAITKENTVANEVSAALELSLLDKLRDSLKGADVAAPQTFQHAADVIMSPQFWDAMASAPFVDAALIVVSPIKDTRWLLPVLHRFKDALLEKLAETQKKQRAKQPQHATKSPVAKQWKPLDRIISSNMAGFFLGAFASSANFAGAAASWEAVKDFGLHPNTTATNTWFNTLVGAKKYLEVIAISERALQCGLQPDSGTLKCLIDAYSVTEDFAKVMFVWNEMTMNFPSVRKPVQPDVRAFCALLRAASEHGRYTETLHILDRMRRADIKPTTECYTHAIMACTCAERPHVAFSLFDEMQTDGAIPSDETFYALIVVAAHHANLELAKEVLTMIEGAGATPTSRIYAGLLYAAQQVGDPSAAFDWLQDYRTAVVVHGSGNDIFPYLAVLHTVASQKDVSTKLLRLIRDVEKQLVEDGIAPTAEYYECLIRVLILGGSFDGAVTRLREARSKNVAVTQNMYLPILRCSASLHGRRGFAVAKQLLAEMEELQVPRTVAAYNAFVAAAADIGDATTALGVIDSIEQYQLAPTEATFEHMLRAAAKVNQPALAASAIEKMTAYGIKPSPDALRIIADAIKSEKGEAVPSNAEKPTAAEVLADLPSTEAPLGEVGRLVRRLRLRQRPTPVADREATDEYHNEFDSATIAEDDDETLDRAAIAPRAFRDKPYQGGFALFPSVSSRSVQRIKAGSITVPVPRGFRQKTEEEVRGSKLAGVRNDDAAGSDDEENVGIAYLQNEIRKSRSLVRIRGSGGVVLSAENEAAALRLVDGRAKPTSREKSRAADDVRAAAGIAQLKDAATPAGGKDDSCDEDDSDIENAILCDDTAAEEENPRKAYARAVALRSAKGLSEPTVPPAVGVPAENDAKKSSSKPSKPTRKQGALFGEDPTAQPDQSPLSAKVKKLRVTSPKADPVLASAEAVPSPYHDMNYRRLEEVFKARGISKSKHVTKPRLIAKLQAYDELGFEAKESTEFASLSIVDLTARLKEMKKRKVGGAAASNWSNSIGMSDPMEAQRYALLAQYKSALLDQHVGGPEDEAE